VDVMSLSLIRDSPARPATSAIRDSDVISAFCTDDEREVEQAGDASIRKAFFLFANAK